MAYTTQTVASADRTAAANNKPFFLVKNILRTRNADPHWFTAAGVNADLASYDALFAADGHLDIPAKPAVQSPTVSTYDIIFDCVEEPGGTSNMADGLVIAGHNLEALATSLANNITVAAIIADNSAFSLNALTVATWTVTPAISAEAVKNKRLADFNLGAFFDLYLEVRHFKLRISSTAPFTAALLPELGEIFFGRRRQMDRKANRPHDPRATASSVARARTKAGGITTYEHYQREAQLSMAFGAHDGADVATGIDAVSVLRNWYRDIGGGTEPFFYVEDPTAAPDVAQFVELDPPSQRFDFEDINIGEISISLLEHPPFVAPEQD